MLYPCRALSLALAAVAVYVAIAVEVAAALKPRKYRLVEDPDELGYWLEEVPDDE